MRRIAVNSKHVSGIACVAQKGGACEVGKIGFSSIMCISLELRCSLDLQVVFLLVDAWKKVGQDQMPHLIGLSTSQQKLVAIYIDRASQHQM